MKKSCGALAVGGFAAYRTALWRLHLRGFLLRCCASLDLKPFLFSKMKGCQELMHYVENFFEKSGRKNWYFTMYILS